MNPNIIVYPAPPQAPLSEDFTVAVDGLDVGLYRVVNRRGVWVSYGYFDFADEVEISITVNFPFETYELLPASCGIVPAVEGQALRFTVSSPCKITLVLDGQDYGRVLHLFANAMQDHAPLKDDPAVIYFGPGYHDLAVECNIVKVDVLSAKKTIYDKKCGVIELKSGQTLYLAGGAFVENATVKARGASNIAIRGRGILSQRLPIDAPAISFKDCNNILVEGVIESMFQTFGWCGLSTGCTNLTLRDYKVVSPTVYSTDGFNLSGCHEVVYEDCFIRSGDDCISIKARSRRMECWPLTVPDGSPPVRDQYHMTPLLCEDPGYMGSNYNIEVAGCQFWSDNNHAVVIGEESQGAYYDNIRFSRCEVLFHSCMFEHETALAIYTISGTRVTNVVFEDINVRNCGKLFAARIEDEGYKILGNQYYPASTRGVYFKNIHAVNRHTVPYANQMTFAGYNAERRVGNIVLDNITINGRKVASTAERLSDMQFTDNITFGDAPPAREQSGNYISNGSFEDDGAPAPVPAGWTVTGDPDACTVSGEGACAGAFNLLHRKDADYSVTTGQTITGLANGFYALRARAMSGGGQDHCYIEACAGGAAQRILLNEKIGPEYAYVQIPAIEVRDGMCRVEIHSEARAGEWLLVDDMELLRIKKPYYSLLKNSSFEEGLDCWESSGSSAYADMPGHYGSYCLKHYSPVQFVETTRQTVTGLEECEYFLTAWVQMEGSIEASVSVSGHGGDTLTTGLTGPHPCWELFVLKGIYVTGGQCTVTIRSSSPGGGAFRIDDIRLTKDNRVLNADFEADSPTVWTEESPNAYWKTDSFGSPRASYVTGSFSHSGSQCLVQHSARPYENACAYNALYLPNGKYAARAWVRSSGGQRTCQMQALGYQKGEGRMTVDIPESPEEWVRVEIRDIPVYNDEFIYSSTDGSAGVKIVFYSKDDKGGCWLNADDVELFRTGPV